jgi:hypothetical protein
VWTPAVLVAGRVKVSRWLRLPFYTPHKRLRLVVSGFATIFLIIGGVFMRTTEKTAGFLILALVVWGALMMVATNFQFQGRQSNRILLLELGSDAATLNQAVQAGDKSNAAGFAHNIELVIRNTHLDFVLILLYWLSFLGLAFLAGKLGKPFFASCSAICISAAALADVWEDRAILAAMYVRPFTDQLAVDISQFSEWKWAFFFLASLFLGVAIALNHRVSQIRRISGGIFIAAAVFGILGLSRHRVSLDFTIWMIWLADLLITAALLLSLWKLYQSLRELNHIYEEHPARIAA